MKNVLSKRLAYTSVFATLAVPSAFAQTPDNPFFRNRYVAVQERSQPQFDAVPVHAGAFNVMSSFGLSAAYNDNVYGQSTNTVSDTVFGLTPKVDIASNWSSHALGAGLSVNSRQYSSESDESATDIDGYLNGRLDVTREFSLGGRVAAAQLSEMRYDPSVNANAAEPTRYNRFGAEVSGQLQRDRLKLRVEGGQYDYDYDDVSAFVGPAIDQDFRDTTESFFGGRASYAISPDVAVYVGGRQSEYDYDSTGTPGNPNRDGTLTSWQIGTDFELSAPFRGDIAVGYLQDDRDDVTRPDFDGLSLDAHLQWFPTQLTTVTFTGASSVYDPGIAASASAAYKRFGVRIDHELRRNIVAFGEVFFQNTDFQGIDREDENLDVTLGLGYKLNRNARVELGYTLHSLESGGLNADRDLDQNILSVGIRLFP